MQEYLRKIQETQDLSFDKIRDYAWESISHLPKKERDKNWSKLDRGVALLDTHELMCQYLWSFGKMHKAKLYDIFSKLPQEIFKYGYEIVDWGCGQAMGTINLFDYLKENKIPNQVKRVLLIEPAEKTLERGKFHTTSYLGNEEIVYTNKKYFEKITSEEIESNSGLPVLHIFSNILDVAQIDLKHLAKLLDSNVQSENYIICVGPLNPNNQRIDAFYNYFNSPLLYQYEDANFKGNWTYKCKLYKLEPGSGGNLIPIEFYPTVQFHAAYELDAYRDVRRKAAEPIRDFINNLSQFVISAPFDIGASVYDDVHPILAVLNNIIVRGLPTRSSVFLEEQFSKFFKTGEKNIELGEISFPRPQKLELDKLVAEIQKIISSGIFTPGSYSTLLQELLTPIAIARFQKLIIEAIITKHLNLQKKEWNILVEEKDVPFAALAVEDFKQLFHNLVNLVTGFEDLNLPDIHLDIISNESFFDSPLHLEKNVWKQPDKIHHTQVYDFVLDMAMLEENTIDKKAFSRFKSLNHCYFKVRSVFQLQENKRNVYTSNLVKYRNLVSKTPQGEYVEEEEVRDYLQYFLTLLFRKQEFRPGQLPILDRALTNQPVIGLLPTGGGKSLTYQIAAILQPGITMIVDPLTSLMKDQYDGLINNGIDFCTFINSTIPSSEKRFREKKMAASQLLLVFLSPERLSILNFRERLRRMHDYNVYFSYGVIDEVHCVSEWGHDFRFSYLHLGRNLYNYVKAKEGVISLFGLTATASFDVLADVERELSGNGAFELDTDTIVRYENSNRLELQYKIEKVKVDFASDNFYDRNGVLDRSLPKAVNVGDSRPVFSSKGNIISSYVEKIPAYISELQKPENLMAIKTRFRERQNNEDNLNNDLSVSMPSNIFEARDEYKEAGIVFCPHRKSTGISVQSNTEKLQARFGKVGSFYGGDDTGVSMQNLENFRDNKLPVMVATKAFGMGIDKPNVRYTINMNYSSSLESFVQEAGRAGRDRRMALSVILLADYNLKKIKTTYGDTTFPLSIIKNKWFKDNDLDKVLNYYNLKVPDEYIETANPTNDVVKLHCSTDNRMFGFNECNTSCSSFNRCQLKKVKREDKGWHSENELSVRLKEQGISLNKSNFQYLSADYATVMYFFNESFKGDVIEKTFMHQLLSTNEVEIEKKTGTSETNLVTTREKFEGFLNTLLDAKDMEEIIVYVPYNDTNSIDISKAIYRMCCIGLIEDFTQDYRNKEYRIVARKRKKNGYFKRLENFLQRYYTAERAKLELKKAKNYEVKDSGNTITDEIRRCLAYLTEFVYDKISEKRKRAIDDMRQFCIEGTDESTSWTYRNEELKDFIYYYFNSKYAKTDYVTESGEPFSLTEDTEGGKRSEPQILLKYLRVADDDIVGVGTPIDNIKHLQGAVRLIKRSLTDSNPALILLNSYTLFYLGTEKSEKLEQEAKQNYFEGMFEMGERMDFSSKFWKVFEAYNTRLKPLMEFSYYENLLNEFQIIIHGNKLKQITEQYLKV